MSEDTESQEIEKLTAALEILSKYIANPASNKTVLSLISSSLEKKLPGGWKKSSVAPYYTEKHARSLMEWLSQLLKEDGTFNYEEEIAFPKESLSCSLKSQSIRIFQSWKYLIDHLDPDGKWAALRKAIRVRITSQGIFLRWKRNEKEISIMESKIDGAIVPTKEKTLLWRQELETFVATCKDGDMFKKNKVLFSKEDMEWIQAYIGNTPDLYILKLTNKLLVVVCNTKLEELNKKLLPME